MNEYTVTYLSTTEGVEDKVFKERARSRMGAWQRADIRFIKTCAIWEYQVEPLIEQIE